jgi:BlaI family transcriptional regulator, penicillinase repressor
MSKNSSLPTDAELEILQILWDGGPQTVRQVWEALGSRGSYTTTLKFLQIMHEKGTVRRDESQMTHVYEAAVEKQESQKQLVGGLIDRAFGGSVSELVLRALSAKPASKKELDAIRALLDQTKNPKKGK